MALTDVSLLLPDHRNLSPQQLGFLNEHFLSHESVCKAHILESELKIDVVNLDINISNLRCDLTKLVVRWISQSIAAKKNVQRLNMTIQSMKPYSSRYGICSRTIPEILDEFSQLVEEVCRVESIRNYVETAIRLEGLVGDIEDSVFGIMNQHSRTMFSFNFPNPSNSLDSQAKQERFLQAINTMNKIEKVLFYVKKNQPQWCRLVKCVDVRLDEIMAILRPQIFADYRALIASLGWPPKLFTSKTVCDQISELQNPLMYMPEGKREIYSKSFLALCALQYLQSRRENRKLNILKQEVCSTRLWAIDELVSSIALQTEYHFLKWAFDQPEYILALVFRISRDFAEGMDIVLQPLIDKARLLSFSAKEAWVSAMVEMLADFLQKRVFSVLVERYKEKHMKSETFSSWLHLIDLILAFDKQMLSLLHLEPGVLEGYSTGVSLLSLLFRRMDWLKIWAKMELRDALKKLKAELKDEKAWLVIEFCTDNERESFKHPSIADTATKIAWKMIERCQNLRTHLVRNEFIQLTVSRFLYYIFNVLLIRCKKPESPSIIINEDTLMRLCISINAARYVESKLQEWSNDSYFMEMMIAKINSSINEIDSYKDSNSFFNDELKTLAELETDWLMEIITDIIFQFEMLSRGYFHNNEAVGQMGSKSANVVTNMDLSLSSNIIEALDFLRSKLQAMRKLLNPIDFIDLWRAVADGIDHFIFRNIFKGNIQFHDEAINQFSTDMQAMFLVFQPFCMRPEAFFPCLRDSLKLLKMEKEEASQLLYDLSNGSRIKYFLRCKVSHLVSDQVKEVLRMRKFCI